MGVIAARIPRCYALRDSGVGMRNRFLGSLLLLPFFILFLHPGSFSQAPSSNTAGNLRFSALVLDSKGVPIRDLQNDEFRLEIAGKPQSVQVEGPTSEPTGWARGLVVVVIDNMHTSWSEQRDLRLNAGKYLQACAKRNVPVSLFLFSRDAALIPVHEYTTTSTILETALEQAAAEMHHKTVPAAGAPEVSAEAQRLVDFYRGQGKYASQQAMEEYPGAILGGFKAVAQYVGGIPGRKSLIWVSSVFPFAVEEKKGRILSPTTQSLAAGKLIYPNLLTPDQVRRLQVVWEDSITAAQSSGLALYPVQTRATPTVPLNPEVINSMTSIAHMTGGIEVHTVGDFFGRFVDLADQDRDAYQLVVRRDAVQDCKSDWCPMTITVKRSGARVLAPQGLFAEVGRVSAQPPAAVAQRGDEASPSAKAIPFTVSWKPAEGTGTKKKVPFIVTFGPGAGIPTEGSNELNVEVMVHAFIGDADKQFVSFGANTHLPEAKLDEVRSKGFVLNNAIELEPGDYSVRFVVHDKVSGRLGVLKIPLKVG